jgi:hypothetical protein
MGAVLTRAINGLLRGREVVPGPPASLWLWVPVALVPALVTLYLSPAILVGPLDWNLYRQDLAFWATQGSPYVVPAQAYSPYETYAYTYPPTSWPLLLVSVLPAAFVWAAVIPLLARPPQIWLVPLSAALLSLGLAIGISLGNVSVLMAGLLVLSFQPGRVGGIAFAGVVALRLYPLVLLPFLWSDRVRLKWFMATFGFLLVSGTLLFGLAGWRDWALIIARLSSDIGLSWNPFGWLGALRIVPAIGISLLGLWLRSPTLTLLGATWINGHVTDHYLVTIAAVLPFEAPLAWPSVIRSRWRAVRGVFARGS